MALQARQTLQQRLIMAPNVTMALEILRMPAMELQTFLQQQIQENPLLELNEDTDDEPADSSSDDSETDASSEGASLDEEWSERWRMAGEQEPRRTDDTREPAERDPTHANAPSLHDSLRMQLGCQRLSPEQRQLGEAIIDHLNEHGYLEDPLEELAGPFGTDMGRLEEALRDIQQLDPPGIGARNLRECLLLQLERNLPAPPVGVARAGDCGGMLTYRILEDHFELFVQHRLRSIARATGASLEDVQAACDCLKQLNPKPGRAFVKDLPPAIVPDLIIHQREGHYDVELNDDQLPHLRVNRYYHKLLKTAETPGEVKEYLQERFRKANWVLKAIEDRNTTLLAIARCLISLQREFVELGPRALKPLTQAQVAGLIGRHPSTVSRAITDKTIHTPHGTFRLEQFFASGVPQTDDSGHVSDETIKSEIRRLVVQEEAAAPLSDTALATRLAERKITVAHRTIAKYRTSLKILPAYLRKRRHL